MWYVSGIRIVVSIFKYTLLIFEIILFPYFFLQKSINLLQNSLENYTLLYFNSDIYSWRIKLLTNQTKDIKDFIHNKDRVNQSFPTFGGPTHNGKIHRNHELIKFPNYSTRRSIIIPRTPGIFTHEMTTLFWWVLRTPQYLNLYIMNRRFPIVPLFRLMDKVEYPFDFYIKMMLPSVWCSRIASMGRRQTSAGNQS